MRIYLTGFMGSGKTAIGRLLAEKLVFPFVDLDSELEHKLSQSIAQIFEIHGEAFFRHQERALLESFQSDPLVVATGGGCFIYNQEWMLNNGTVIHLDVPFSEIVRRIGGDPNRPLWKNAQKLYSERSAVYKKAHYTVKGSGTVEELVERIMLLPLPGLKKIREN